MKKTFYSNGKLLLTGEYLVLDGAKAIAIPTKFGQSLTVKPSEEVGINWKSYDENGLIWFSGFYDISTKKVGSHSDDWQNITLASILNTARINNPDFLRDSMGYLVESHIDFPRKWGLGTSSTLINNIAQWAEVDPYILLDNSFGGSGYDLAAAKNDTPILYKLDKAIPKMQNIELPPRIKENVFFVYLDKKQSSREGIKRYREVGTKNEEAIKSINRISLELLDISSIAQLNQLIDEHEAIISSLINLPTVKEQHFNDYHSAIKSLGAWGGDFIMVVGDDSDQKYFREKGFEIILKYSEMIK